MTAPKPERRTTIRSQRPRATTVFAAAFLAGAAAAVGVNRTLDVHLAQRQPRVESEPIFVALRSLPQGSPVTVWDVALRDWPKAMLPAAAMRARDSLEGMVLRHPLREGQPILSVQLVKATTATDVHVAEVAPLAPQTTPVESATPQPDLWAPAEVPAAPTAAVTQPTETPLADATPTESVPVVVAEPAPETVPAEAVAAPSAATDGIAAHVATGSDAIDAAPVASVAPVTEAAPATDATPVAPALTDSVVVTAPASTDIDPVVATAAVSGTPAVEEPRQQVTRYLVVPERIALEADRSFVAIPETPAQPSPSTAPVVQTAPTRTAAPAAQHGRAQKPVNRTSSSRDRQPQRPPRSASTQQSRTQPQGSAWSLRALLPSMSVGMGAVEPTPSPAAGPTGAAKKAGSVARNPAREPTSQPASRGFSLFR